MLRLREKKIYAATKHAESGTDGVRVRTGDTDEITLVGAFTDIVVQGQGLQQLHTVSYL